MLDHAAIIYIINEESHGIENMRKICGKRAGHGGSLKDIESKVEKISLSRLEEWRMRADMAMFQICKDCH